MNVRAWRSAPRRAGARSVGRSRRVKGDTTTLEDYAVLLQLSSQSHSDDDE